MATVTSAFQAKTADAAQITNRSLTLQAGASDGGAKPGGIVNHLFNFNLVSGSNVGSIQFLYCTTASGTCTMPTGLDTTAATLGTQTGAATGFTIVTNTAGAPNGTVYLTRSAATVTPGAASYQLQSVKNPTTANQAFFVRISTFASTDTTGGATDTGTVTASTANDIILSGTMPESLIFCTGATVGTTNSIPDCSKATAGTVSFNQLFSPTDTATASSQMAASTNATTGFNITVAGTTLTSGSNTIPGIAATTGGTRGVSQFGMNLKANTTTTSTPAVGAEIAPVADNANYRGQAATGYDTVDNFKFVPGDSVANSASSGAGAPTNSQIYTASYIVNVAGNQPAGTYTTTLTYVCTATF
jgi:hypothetical protein